jgi:hypothetical protein
MLCRMSTRLSRSASLTIASSRSDFASIAGDLVVFDRSGRDVVDDRDVFVDLRTDAVDARLGLGGVDQTPRSLQKHCNRALGQRDAGTTGLDGAQDELRLPALEVVHVLLALLTVLAPVISP